jgi:hypothetical protein
VLLCTPVEWIPRDCLTLIGSDCSAKCERRVAVTAVPCLSGPRVWGHSSPQHGRLRAHRLKPLNGAKQLMAFPLSWPNPPLQPTPRFASERLFQTPASYAPSPPFEHPRDLLQQRGHNTPTPSPVVKHRAHFQQSRITASTSAWKATYPQPHHPPSGKPGRTRSPSPQHLHARSPRSELPSTEGLK